MRKENLSNKIPLDFSLNHTHGRKAFFFTSQPLFSRQHFACQGNMQQVNYTEIPSVTALPIL